MNAGSRWSIPSRSAIFCGPAKARSIGNCWSSSMPARSANASRSSSASAAGSPVIAIGRVFVLAMGLLLCLDRQDRAGRFEQYALRVAAKDEFADSGASAQPDHDDVCPLLLRDRDEVLGGLEAANQQADLVLDGVPPELRPDIGEIGLL